LETLERPFFHKALSNSATRTLRERERERGEEHLERSGSSWNLSLEPYASKSCHYRAYMLSCVSGLFSKQMEPVGDFYVNVLHGQEVEKDLTTSRRLLTETGQPSVIHFYNGG
jgi:hypothetical protein